MGAHRQSRFARPADPKPIRRLRDLHVDVIDAVYKYRYLTNEQLAFLLRHNPENLKRPVRDLFNNHYLLRPWCQRNGYWHTGQIYHSTSNKGAEILRERRDYCVPDNRYDQYEKKDRIQNWDHDVTQVNFVVKLTTSVQKHKNLELLLPKDMHERGIVTSSKPWKPRGWEPLTWDTNKGRLTPDEVVMFYDKTRPEGRKVALVLVEIDMGTEPHERFLKEGTSIRGKIEKYAQAYNNRMHTDTFSTKNIRIAFVTKTAQRINRMIELTQNMGITQRLFLFTTHEDVKKATNLLDLTWVNNRGEVVYLTRAA